MNDRILAKIEESRARAAREVAAAKSQREYAAGLRDEFGAAVTKESRARATRRIPTGPRITRGMTIAYQVGDPCKRCERPMGPDRSNGRVIYGAKGHCRGCVGREGEPVRQPALTHCADCGKEMRPRTSTAAKDFPHLAQRATARLCQHCRYPEVEPRVQHAHCVTCGAPFRERGQVATPGTRLRAQRGMCFTDYKLYTEARRVEGD